MTLRSGAEIAVGVFVILVLFLFLGGRGLNEPDEGRYAEVSREMLLDGNILTPHLNGIAHFQKPPLIYWASAASMALGVRRCRVEEVVQLFDVLAVVPFAVRQSEETLLEDRIAFVPEGER